MRRRLLMFFRSLAFAGLAALPGLGCNKNTPKGIDYTTSTIPYVLANSSNATLFKAAITQGGLDSTLAGMGPFSLFVPTDGAMVQAGITSSVIAAMSMEQAKNFVLYHTYAGNSLGSGALIGTRESKFIMANGDSVFITGDSNNIYLGGVPVTAVDLIAANGVLNALGGVLTPPTKTLAQLVAGDTSLTFLAAAIQHAAATPDSLGVDLAGGAVFTFFAPVNDAFRQLGYQNVGDLASANPDTLRHLVLAHLFPQRLMNYDIPDQALIANSNDSMVLFTQLGLTSSLRLVSSDSASAVNLIDQNIRAFNGTLFTTDGILR